mmetsp:Transcript_25380/g.76980  ORF Transcript_25380/g.76980 Transcript_25380/m.76980 type:complete len:237 (-) Transcript_25380:465-1175(-)
MASSTPWKGSLKGSIRLASGPLTSGTMATTTRRATCSCRRRVPTQRLSGSPRPGMRPVRALQIGLTLIPWEQSVGGATNQVRRRWRRLLWPAASRARDGRGGAWMVLSSVQAANLSPRGEMVCGESSRSLTRPIRLLTLAPRKSQRVPTASLPTLPMPTIICASRGIRRHRPSSLCEWVIWRPSWGHGSRVAVKQVPASSSSTTEDMLSPSRYARKIFGQKCFKFYSSPRYREWEQ